ncbi:MAG: tetratricopeptide repeat protein [Calditrichaeota bacterium]|nr:tetratricopeptide repeat protein [Calditrichota bacterium]
MKKKQKKHPRLPTVEIKTQGQSAVELFIPPQPSGKKLLPLGWLALFIPLCIIVVVLIAENYGWVAEQKGAGALLEAINNANFGLTAMEQGDFENAKGYFGAAIKIKADYAEPYLNLGIIAYKQGDDNLALQLMSRALELKPRKMELIYNNLGMVHGKRKEWDKAIAMFLRSLELNVRATAVYRNIAQTQAAKGDYEGAVDAWLRAIDAHPTLSNQYWEMLREATYSLEDEEALRAAQEALERGVSEADLAKYDSIVINQSLAQDKKLADDYYNLSLAYAKLGQYRAAVSAAYEAIKINPNDAPMRNKLGIYYANIGDLVNAEEQFATAVRLKSDYEDAKFNLERCRSKLAGSAGG